MLVVTPLFLCAVGVLPSACTVAALTTNPSAQWIAVDYCRVERDWQELRNKTVFVPSGSNLLHLLQESEKLPLPCTKSQTLELIARCRPVASLISDNEKLCDCGLLPECHVHKSNSAMIQRCQTHLKLLPSSAIKHVDHFDLCLRYYNVSQTLAKTTWNSSAVHNQTSFAALDACAAVGNYGEPSTKYSDIFTEYVVLHWSKTRQLTETLQLRCKLLEISVGQTVSPYFRGLMQQWFVQYCLHTIK